MIFNYKVESSKAEKRNTKLVENLKHNEMLDPWAQAWQNSSALDAQTPGRVAVVLQSALLSLNLDSSTGPIFPKQ